MNQELTERYVAGRLEEAEAQAFEEYCLMNPEFAKQVEFEQRLKVGITQVASGSTAEFVRSNHPGRWPLALAAGVLLAIGAAFFVWNRCCRRRRHDHGRGSPQDQHGGAALRCKVRGRERTALRREVA